MSTRKYTSVSTGDLGTKNFAVYVVDAADGTRVSPWNDVPLYRITADEDPTEVLNFICEIPKWTRRKMEIMKNKLHHPIQQDLDASGNLRSYKYGDMMFNYGALPQTWEDPTYICPHTLVRGDDDPVDVVEIGSSQLATGSITPVKILGVLGLIDNGETDWKIIAIRTQDPMAPELHELEDVERCIPGLLQGLRTWLQNYKKAEGQPPAEFAFAGEYQSRAFAMSVIHSCHAAWASRDASQ